MSIRPFYPDDCQKFHLFTNYLSNVYYALKNIPGAKDKTANELDKIPDLLSSSHLQYRNS